MFWRQTFPNLDCRIELFQLPHWWPFWLSLECTCQIKVAIATPLLCHALRSLSPALTYVRQFQLHFFTSIKSHLAPALGLCPSSSQAIGRKNCLCSTRVALPVIRKLNLQFSLSQFRWSFNYPHPLWDLAISFDFYFYFISQFLIAPRYSWLWRQLSEIVLETMWVSDFCRPRRTLKIIEIVLPFCDGIRRHTRVPSIEVLVFGCNPLTLCLLTIVMEFSRFERFWEFVWILVIDFEMPRSRSQLRQPGISSPRYECVILRF